jgi:simple sugar transport system ATP-binding protein
MGAAAGGSEVLPPLLNLARISKHYGGVTALTDVALSLHAGEVHCLIGENGSGKSTLIKIVSGVVTPEPGAGISFAGSEVSRLTPAEARRLGVQVIFQDLSLFPNLSVAENVGFDRHLGQPFGLAERAALSRLASDALGRIGVSIEPGRKVETLPIAQRQLVAIARALAADARLVIMDEPTASLTKAEVERLLSVTRQLAGQGLCIVFVSHRLDEIRRIADRVTVLRDGRKIGTFAAGEVDAARLAFLMTGQSFAYTPKAPVAAPPVMEVERLTRAGDFYDVSLSIGRGEVLGLTGLLGSGRTELALALFGMNPPDSGTLRLAGAPIALHSNRAAIRAGIAYVSEDRLTLGLNMRQSIAANITLTVLDRLRGALGLLDPALRAAEVRHWIDELHIRVGAPEHPVSSLSGGNQQRVVLAKWMATAPRLLILDSPTVGVDVAAKNGIYQIVEQLSARGVAVLLISDEIPEAHYHCHRVLVMRQGRIVAEHHPAREAEAALDRLVHG